MAVPKTPCKTLLLAEDNIDIRESLTEALEIEGYEVHATCNGKEALDWLQTQSEPALVLLDLMMPVMSGWEFLDAQQADKKLSAHPVIVLSAVASTRGQSSLSSAKAAGYLTKPVDLYHLLSTVRKYCGAPPSGENCRIAPLTSAVKSSSRVAG